jgi:CDP-diacylglycerol--glycerol-3-phosphate 3-phosphatidyltransferase
MPELKLRSRIDAQLRPLAQHAAAAGLAGDRISWTILVLAAVAGALLLALPAVLPGLSAVLLLLPAALAGRGVLGGIARLQQAERPDAPSREPVLREVADAGADALLYLPLAAYPGLAAAPVILLLVLGLLVEIAGIAALARGKSRLRDGPMNSSDRAIVFALAGLILALEPGTTPWLPWLLLPAAGLALATLLRRLADDE